MTKLPVVNYRTLARKLSRAGYVCIRTGKHDVYCHKAKNLTIPLPHHTGDVPKGLVRAIIREMEISVDDFCNL